MDIERAFRTEIVATPYNEAPRLVFADWLEERGDDVQAAYWREFDASQLYTRIVEDYYGPFAEVDGHGAGYGYGSLGGDGGGRGYPWGVGQWYDEGDGYGGGHGYGHGDGDGLGWGNGERDGYGWADAPNYGYGDGFSGSGDGRGCVHGDGQGGGDGRSPSGKLRILGSPEPEDPPEINSDAANE